MKPTKKMIKTLIFFLKNVAESQIMRNFASLLAQKQNGSESKTETAASERREIIEIFAKRKFDIKPRFTTSTALIFLGIERTFSASSSIIIPFSSSP